MQHLFDQMAALTARDEPFVLATVITRNGSAPRSVGARMLVRSDGTTAGTVGGGILEAQVERLAGEVLRNHTAVVANFAFSGNDAATMDAICGGQVDVLVEWIDPAESNWKRVMEQIRSNAARHKKAWLLTALPGDASTGEHPPLPQSLPHGVVQLDGSVEGSLPAEFPLEKVFEILQPEVLSTTGQRWMVEPLETGGTVYIFGAGHVGRSLASFTRAVSFWTVVLDDRPEYANPQQIPSADEIIVLDSFEGAFTNLRMEADSFIVIVTRGHLNDGVVLAQALKTPAGYIGMIGSRRKCALIFAELRNNGFSDADISRVHAPIGLPIRAETPEEIGVSITAEMIQARAALSGAS